MSGSHPEITVRPANPADFVDVQRLNAELFKFEVLLNGNSRNLNWPFLESGSSYIRAGVEGQNNQRTFVAESADHVIGYLAASLYTKTWLAANPMAEIDNMFIEEPFRRHGVGSQLMAAFKSWAREQGARRLKVGALTANHPAIGFYERHGFKNLETIFEQPAED